MIKHCLGSLRIGKFIGGWLVAGALMSGSGLCQSIPNPSFETDTFINPPGYSSANAPITGWTLSDPNRGGLNNPSAGLNFFADNGTVPNGNQVAFLQSGATLSTTMSGLVAGQTYKVTFRANAQTPAAAGEYPNVHVSAGAQDIWNISHVNLGGTNPYGFLAFEFTATGASDTLSIANDGIFETALLLDDFRIALSPAKWSIAAWNDDSDSGIDPSYVYTHAYSFGSTASPIINSIAFIGVAGPNPAVAGAFSTANFGNDFTSPDDNNVSGTGSVLADQFIYQGGDIGTNFQTIVISGLSNGTDYVATIYSVGWENPTMDTRWMTVNAGGDYLTFNQDMFGNNNGIRVNYRFTADASGSATLRIAPVRPANTSMHVYGFSNREAVSRNVRPQITLQPQSTTVAEGVDVALKVAATGFPAPTFRWRRNGSDIAGANTDTYSFIASPANAGSYDVVVANLLGSVTSQVAKVTVGMPMANPSFEADLFAVWPGYVNDNGPITGWTSLNNHGVNPVSDGRSPFADNGAIPHGTHAAFMQGDGVLSQTVSGFVIGNQYYVHYYENGRNDGVDPAVEVKVGGNTVLPAHVVPPAGGSNPYFEVVSDVFVASATSLDLAFVKSNPLGGDSTLLIDNITIVPVAPGTAPFIGRQPAPVLVSVGESATFSVQAVGSLPLSYQWLKNGGIISGAVSSSFSLNTIQKPDEADYSVRVSNSSGSVTSAVAHLTVFETIPDLFSTGLDASRAPVTDGLADPHYLIITNIDDANSNAAIVQDSSRFPISTGTWMRDTDKSKWIGPRFFTEGAAAGTYVYRTTINLTDRDPSTLIVLGQWATDDTGLEIRVNGVSVGAAQANGFANWTPFTLYGTNNFVAGTNTIDFVVSNGSLGYTGLRVEIVRSNVRVPPGVAPEITTQPISQTVAEGDNVTFTGEARGTAPLSYQWLKNGSPIPGKTTTSLSLTSVTTSDAGTYALRVSNSVSTVTSSGAQLNVAYRPIAVAFGTGVGTNGQLLEAGAVDPHFILGSSADASYPGPDAIVVNDGYPVQAGAWLLNGPNSKWIAPQANQNDQGASGGGNLGGAYTYQTTVNLTGYDLSKVRLVGAWGADDSGGDILVNGFSTGLTSGGFGSLAPFVITNHLIAGVNTLDFVVNNNVNANGTPNPTGLRVDLRAYLTLDQPPTIQLTRSGNSLSVSWTPDTAGLRLQSATTLSGPWNDVPAQTNPYTTTITGPAQFFRVVR